MTGLCFSHQRWGHLRDIIFLSMKVKALPRENEVMRSTPALKHFILDALAGIIIGSTQSITEP